MSIEYQSFLKEHVLHNFMKYFQGIPVNQTVKKLFEWLIVSSLQFVVFGLVKMFGKLLLSEEME